MAIVMTFVSRLNPGDLINFLKLHTRIESIIKPFRTFLKSLFRDYSGH